jgi:DNA-binding NarL/FixJ family response regulator
MSSRRDGAAPAVSIVVADDHELFRGGLVRLLVDAGLDVVGEADTAAAALELVALTSPDVVLLDVTLPDLPGAEAAGRLAIAHPHLHIVVLSTVDSQSEVLEALISGACCCLLKDASPEEIIDAIDTAVRGESMVPPALVTQLVDRVRAARTVGRVAADAELNKRERDVLCLLAEGYDNREIAARLFISPSTVKHHVSSIIAKLGVGNRIQAAVRAVHDGLI